MAMIRVYHILCPTCEQSISLLETMLEQIIHNRLVSDTGAPFLTLVCSGCMTGFRYNYVEKSLGALMPESALRPDRKSPTAFSFRVECVDSNCESQVELVAIRDTDTTKEDVLAELPKWNLDAIRCENNDPLLFPDPEKSY